MMWRKFLIVGLVLGISMIFLSAPAWAEEMMDEEMSTACEQADLEGNWKARAYNENYNIWDEVDVEIDADGAFQGGKYTEYEAAWDNDPSKKPDIDKKDKYRITGGELLVDEDTCIITGYMELSNGTSYDVLHCEILVKKDSPKELILSNQPPDDGSI